MPLESASNGGLFDFVEARAGQQEARRILAFIVTWDLVQEALGRAPTPEEYAAWWRVDRTTIGRQLKRFRECVGEDTPERLVNQLRSLDPHWRSGGVAGVGSYPVEALGLAPDAGNPWRLAGTVDRQSAR